MSILFLENIRIVPKMTKNKHNFNKIKYILAIDKTLNTIGHQRFKKIQKSGLRFQELWEMSDTEVRAKLGREEFVEKLLKERGSIDPNLLVKRLQKLDIKALTILGLTNSYSSAVKPYK